MALSVIDRADICRMAMLQGRVQERQDEGCRYPDPISRKYTGAPFPSRGSDRLCFVIAVVHAAARTLDFRPQPGLTEPSRRRVQPLAYSSAARDSNSNPTKPSSPTTQASWPGSIT